MRRIAFLLLLAALALSPLLVLAADAVPTEKDAIASARAVRLAEKLRCLVCQNQTIADSNAELAQDLRQQIHEQIAAGKSDDQIVDYMVARYGDFVLYQPPLKATTVLLWAGPALLLLIAVVVAVRALRMRAGRAEEAPLSAEEHERALRLLAADTKEPKGQS
jgi:cytochrome c-type biogenesis protein CcmH